MHAIPDGLCYLNGDYLDLRDAKVSVFDRGFMFGDGVYEALPIYARRPFRWAEHMRRFSHSLAKTRIANPLSETQWLERCRQLIAAQTSADQLLYIQVTRGVAPRNLSMPSDTAPTVFMMSNPLTPPTPEQRHRGVACTTARDFRWERGDIKSISLLGNVLARQMSVEHGAIETILFRDGHLTEASSSNVWMVHEGAVLGPPTGEYLLEGIRYELIRELCDEEGIGYNLRPIAEAELRAADEILLSSASKEVLPVTLLDGEQVGHGALRGKPGPVSARLYAAYQRAKIAQSV